MLAVVACSGYRAKKEAERFSGVGRSDTLQVMIDESKQFDISPFIYGINGYETPPNAVTPDWPAGITLSRFGGNRLTAFNWENNASNAGLDYGFQNDAYLGGGNVPGEAVRGRVAAAIAKGAGMIVTVPMLDHVSRDLDGTPVGTDSATQQARLATRFIPSLPIKHAPFDTTPQLSDNAVYQDEFVWWLQHKFPDATTSSTHPLFFALDNEPDAWPVTHEELLPKVNGKAALLTYDDFIKRTIAYASAVKSVDANALVFGPGPATWTGATTLGRARESDPTYGHRDFLDVYLEQLHAAEVKGGHRLLDVLDVHWYPATGDGTREITNDTEPQTPAMVLARLQAPRSLWDSDYNEHTWVNRVTGGAIRLLPRLREKIAKYYPGTKIGISEYFYGRGGDISGGIAQADVLGVFGREGVFAATLWPLANPNARGYGGSANKAYAYIIGAFRGFRDFDGNGATFGKRGLSVTSSDAITSSAYASISDTDSSDVILVLINKQSRARKAVVSTTAHKTWSHMASYVMQSGTPNPTKGVAPTMNTAQQMVFEMPAQSVSTILLHE